VPLVAGASVAEVIVSAFEVVAIDIPADCVWFGELLSVTEMVKFDVPLLVGVPEMTPEDERESPAGGWPEATDHE
jgi:hypothetical protein